MTPRQKDGDFFFVFFLLTSDERNSEDQVNFRIFKVVVVGIM